MASTDTIIEAVRRNDPGGADRLISQLSPTGMVVLNNRMRAIANRRGLTLSRSRRRDPGALDYGTYTIVGRGGEIVAAAVPPSTALRALLDYRP
jgi:hypothetical protein